MHFSSIYSMYFFQFRRRRRRRPRRLGSKHYLWMCSRAFMKCVRLALHNL